MGPIWSETLCSVPAMRRWPLVEPGEGQTLQRRDASTEPQRQDNVWLVAGTTQAR